MTLEQRFLRLRRKMAGIQERTKYETDLGVTKAEHYGEGPASPWHIRILSELDFCLQMKAHAGTDVTGPVEAALDLLEREQARETALTDSVCREAERLLMPLAEEARTYTLLLAGHAHLDMNWMWGWDETVATTVATFRTMLNLMEEYPDFCFSQSQASVYKIVEDYAPELKAHIQRRIREGRWEVTASAWVETDKNMPCAESLMNHIVYTKNYLRESWGIDPATLDLDFSPDTFGHSAFLPELDSLGRIKYYYHCRGNADTDKVLYRWRAPSGRELLVYREPYWYNSAVSPASAIGLPRIAALSGGMRTGMAVYGVGDHGGGPTRRDLNRVKEMQSWPVFPALKFSPIHGYFAAAEEYRDRVPVLEGELNSIFTGCYTTQSRVKKGNHRAENALLTSELLSSLVSDALGTPYEGRIFETAWRKTLFTHFHDILPGSCTQDSREYAMGLYQEALSAANCRSVNALESLTAAIDTSSLAEPFDSGASISEGAGVGFGLADGNIPTQESGVGLTRILHVVNPTGKARHENAHLTVWDWPGNIEYMEFYDPSGNVLPSERTTDWLYFWGGHRYFSVNVEVEVPAYGYATVLLRERTPDEVTDSFMRKVAKDLYHPPIGEAVLENDYLRAGFDRRTGRLVSLIDKRTGSERLRAGEGGGVRLVRTQKNAESAWVIDRYLEVIPLNDLVRMTVTPGLLTSAVETEHRVLDSRVTTRVTLGRRDKFLRVSLHIDWREQALDKEEQPLLTYCLPLADATGRALCDVPGGAVWRQAREQDMPCLRYAAAEMSDGRVLALASDSKYGFRLMDGDLSVTLINTAYHPDPYPERGIQDCNLFVLPFEGDPAALAGETELCLRPLQYVTNTAHPGALPLSKSIMETESSAVVVTGAAQRDGVLTLRMYNTAKEPCPITVRLPRPIGGAECTDLFGAPLPYKTETSRDTVTLTLPPFAQAELRIDR